MRLKGTKTESEFRSELLLSKKSLFESSESTELRNVLEDEYSLLMSAYVLHLTPDQCEDIYLILVNIDKLICVEIERSGDIAPIIEHMNLDEYKNGLTKINQIRLAVAQDLAKTDIEEANIEAIFYVTPRKPRPNFYSLAEYLWGKGVDIDSDGNSESIEDGNWTELTLILRSDIKQRIDIDPVEEEPLTFRISGPKVLSEKAANYLARK